jgi:hypothetical protein
VGTADLEGCNAAVSAFQCVILTGDVMKAPVSGPARAPRHDQPAMPVPSSVAPSIALSVAPFAGSVVRLRYRACAGMQRALFAAPPVDLLTLVIADAIKRREQAEIQRPALRDAYELPVSQERNADRDADIRRREYDDLD